MPTDQGPASSPFVRVRVVGDPGGDPPRWVREAWLGVEFDAVRITRRVRVGSSRGRRWWSQTRRGAWSVAADEAVSSLMTAGQADAAAWWESSGLLGGFTVLLFAADACEP